MNNNLYIAAIGRAVNGTSRNFSVQCPLKVQVWFIKIVEAALMIFADKCPNFTFASHFTTSHSAFSRNRETSRSPVDNSNQQQHRGEVLIMNSCLTSDTSFIEANNLL